MAATPVAAITGNPGIVGMTDYSGATPAKFPQAPVIGADNNLSVPGKVIPYAGGTGLGYADTIPLQNWRTTLGAVLPVVSATNTFFTLLTFGSSSYIESATTNNAVETCGMIAQVTTPQSYNGTNPLTLTVNANIKTSGTGTLVATLTAAAYSIGANGAFGPNMVTTVGSAVVGTSAAAYTFTITNPGGTGGFVASQAVAIQLTSAQAETASVNSNVQINSTTWG